MNITHHHQATRTSQQCTPPIKAPTPTHLQIPDPLPMPKLCALFVATLLLLVSKVIGKTIMLASPDQVPDCLPNNLKLATLAKKRRQTYFFGKKVHFYNA